MQVADQSLLVILEFAGSAVVTLNESDQLFLSAAEAIDAAMLFEDDKSKRAIVLRFHFAGEGAHTSICVC